MRRWWAGWTLRARLVTLTVALLAVVLTVISVITGLAVRASLHSDLDERVNKLGVVLQAEGQLIANPDRYPYRPRKQGGRDGGLGFIRGAGTAFGTIGVEVLDGRPRRAAMLDGDLDGGRLVRLTPEQVAAVADVPADFTPHTRQVPGLCDYRLIAYREGTTGLVMITGLPMDDVAHAVARFTTVHVVVSVGGLILVGFAGAAAVSLTLRPLRRIAETATRVSEQNLHQGEVGELERVPCADTHPGTEVGQVGASLNRLLDHVGSALTARQSSESRVRQFVADASHELRTPLASIRGYAELTRRGGEETPPRTAHALRRVESEADRMTALVEDLLLLARLDSGRPLAPEPVELPLLVVDAVSDARTVGPDHRWRLELPDAPVCVAADPARLHQILVNLLTNARTHTPPGTTVTAAVREEPDSVVVTVSDDGPGIPPELLPQVFERFAKGDTSRSRAAGSSGLGLAIVRALAVAHGGSVEVHSVPGRTAFEVRLPYGPQPCEDGAPPEDSVPVPPPPPAEPAPEPSAPDPVPAPDPVGDLAPGPAADPASLPAPVPDGEPVSMAAERPVPRAGFGRLLRPRWRRRYARGDTDRRVGTHSGPRPPGAEHGR
ncbi:HAMP domain-containing sensor histidine kinase [Streptomyces sp. NPDC000594]|uniref:sensor histidine kinase n=1 Tax=Streptomyces sp. NPDC000594 TaxID=3154261 RepID=UPI0033301202